MCTLTPGQILHQPGLVVKMHSAGMTAVRLNTAHLQGTEQLTEIATRLKQLVPGIGILLDTKGPEVRTTAVEGDGHISFALGDKVVIRGTESDLATSKELIHVNYPHIHREVKPGHRILVDDARLALIVADVDGHDITATVERGAELGSRKGLSVEGVDLDLPPVSAHDRQYIAYAAESPLIDVIAHSFVRSADDVRAVRSVMGTASKPVIAKIENRRGIDRLPQIMAEADGILIARGDLTAALGRDAIPAAQQLIARATVEAGLPLYLATNILPSLIGPSTTPSASDLEGIEVAKEQGVDVFLLTNETAAGEHPLESVAVLAERLR